MSQSDKDQENTESQLPAETTDKTDQPESSAEQVEKDLSDQEESGFVESGKKSKLGLAFFILILLLLSFAGGGYLAYDYMNGQALQRETVLQSELVAGMNKIEQRFTEIEATSNVVARQQSDIQTALTAIASDTEKQMQALAERIANRESQGAEDWTIAEVEYLLRIANQRLVTSQDHKTAVSMLETADGILAELAYPELVPVRRQLALDITQLQLAKKVDVQGLYFELEAISTEVSKLTQYEPEEVMAPLVNEDENAVSVWSKVKAMLAQYVRVDTNAGEPQYLVTDEEEMTRRLSIQLLIKQAQLALLSNRQDIFTQALTNAAKDVGHYYDAEALSLKLNEVAGLQIEQAPMNVNESIRILSDVVDQLTNSYPDPDSNRLEQ